METVKNLPLAVDLDGSLVSTDLSEESVIKFILKRPWGFLLILIWWLGGRANVKRKLAGRVDIDVTSLPYKPAVLDWLISEKARGRELALVSGSDQKYVDSVAAHLGIFDQAKGSDGRINCVGKNKALWLINTYGEKGFDYLGNSGVDLHVWQHSQAAVLVSDSAKLRARVPRLEKQFSSGVDPLSGLFKSLRLHQWVKSLLIFMPAVAAHSLLDLKVLGSAALAFLSFGCASSSAYILNDLLDLDSDRRHPKKCLRPFAAGMIRGCFGMLASAILICISVLLSLSLSQGFFLVIMLYYASVLCYSCYFKDKIIADVVMLAGFYSLRVLAGGVATGIDVSRWLLLFSVFFFFSLACIKRFSELRGLSSDINTGRGYLKSDDQIISAMGVGSGFISVLVIALWANSIETGQVYVYPQALWLLCPLLMYWTGRVWLIAERGQLHFDPVVFALKDKLSYLVIIIALMLMYCAATLGF